MVIPALYQALKTAANPELALGSARFFKTGPGQYGEGDVFVGIRIPQLRKLAIQFNSLPFSDLSQLLQSPIHEYRMLAVLLLVLKVKKSSPEAKKEVFEFYLAHLDRFNNWDLIDGSAPYVVGPVASREQVLEWVNSPSLWIRRIAMVSTLYGIRAHHFELALEVAQRLLGDKEDLIHKAVGWMLREVGKQDEAVLCQFLEQHRHRMPRTSLRYAIERLSSDQKHYFMKKN